MTSAQHLRNMMSVYDSATPHQRAEAAASYQRYHDFCLAIATQTGYSLDIAAGVFAALSPNNSYVSNLRNCRTLLEAHAAGKAIDQFKVNTYGANKRKAWAMACGEQPTGLLKGRKTKAFFFNIAFPTDPTHVTVDGHIYWIWMGRKGRLQGPRKTTPKTADVTPSLSETLYEEIADCVRFVAEQRGVIPCQAQAIMWQQWRYMHNVRGAQQMDLLAQDAFAAGVPDHPHVYAGCGK